MHDFPLIGWAIVRGEVLPATSLLPHRRVFSILVCLLPSSSSLPPLLSSSQIAFNTVLTSQPWPPSPSPRNVTLPLSLVICHPPSFLRVLPTVVCSSSVSLSSSSAIPSLPLTPPFFSCLHSCYFSYLVVFAHSQPLLL